jgi:DNA-binding SARP family transcriptional activator
MIVLAVLLINANRRVSTADLLQTAWGHPDIDETQLHKSISMLRHLLGRIGRRDDLVTHPRFGYELRVPEELVDKLLFERLVREAETVTQRSRIGDEADLLHRALRLWHGGHVAEGVPAVSALREVIDLEQRRKRAAGRLFELRLGQGQYEGILDGGPTMVGYYPEDRRLCEQLMIALYRTGHAAEAIEAYVRHQAALDKATGALPEEAIRQLARAIVAADNEAISKYERKLARVSPSDVRLEVLPAQLPPDQPDFVGRDELVAEARSLLTHERDSVPVVVISGPAGIGKSALAVRVAHLVRDYYPDGQVFLGMGGTTQPLSTSEALAQLLRAFGVARIPESTIERAATFRSVVAGRRVLVVIDDVSSEAQVGDLIPGNPGCGVLATARQRLPGLAGAYHIPALEPLDPEASVDLFLRTVRRSAGNVDEEPEATRHLVNICAGLPLALRIAAALRARDYDRSTADLVGQLSQQRLDGFVYGEQSVERSIGLGFDRLDDSAQLLFLALGLLKLPEFALWTATAILESIGADPSETLRQLARLHLIERTGTAMRYRFHDLTRDYATRRAESAARIDKRELCERVYTAFLTLVRRAHYGIYGADFDVIHSAAGTWEASPEVLNDLDQAPLSWFELERANLRSAVSHTAELGFTEICWDMAISAHEFYAIRGYHDDWLDTHTVALKACRDAGSRRGEAAVLTILGQPALAASRRDGVPGPDVLTQAVELFQRSGDHHGQAIALRTLANSLQRRGHLDQALELLNNALPLYEDSNDTVGYWQTLRYLGQILLDLGDHQHAVDALVAADRTARTIGRERLMAQTAYWLGQAHLASDNLIEAERSFRSVVDSVDPSDYAGRAYAAYALGETARRSGALTDAEEQLGAATVLARQADDAALQGRISLSMAELYAQQGRREDEVEALRRAAAKFAASDAMYLEEEARSTWHNRLDV